MFAYNMMWIKKVYVCVWVGLWLFNLLIVKTYASEPSHGTAVFGALKYSADFTHFDYVNSAAPKGGTFTTAAMGTFDSLNPFIVMGTPASGVLATHATLFDSALDETGSSYAYVAESIEIAKDKSFIIFHLNSKACFDNGDRITADDVIFSFNTLREKGSPVFKTYYKGVSHVEKIDATTVKFHVIDARNRQLAMILGQLPILSKVFFDVHDFAKPLATPSPASGAYKVVMVDFGKRLVFERVKNWWGENLSTQKGLHNFDRLVVDYYRDSNAMFEAFKAGKVDFRHENSAKLWTTSYDFSAVQKGHVKKELIAHKNPTPTHGFFFNLRRPIFKDWRVRAAITQVFDFAWINKNIFSNQYVRNESIFPNSPFAQKGLPEGAERDVLMDYRKSYPEHVSAALFDTPFTLPQHHDANDIRDSRKKALALLAEAGWHLIGGKLIHKDIKKPLTFEFLNVDPAMEKIVLHFKGAMAAIGIDMRIRSVDVSSYVERVHDYNYDMICSGYNQTIMPGNEQRVFWGSKGADVKGGMNYAGIQNPVIDDLCEKIAEADNYEALTVAMRALDRVLLTSYVMIPNWHRGTLSVAYWDRFSKPEAPVLYAHTPYTASWWFDVEKDKKLKDAFIVSDDDMIRNEIKQIGVFGRLRLWITHFVRWK